MEPIQIHCDYDGKDRIQVEAPIFKQEVWVRTVIDLGEDIEDDSVVMLKIASARRLRDALQRAIECQEGRSAATDYV